MHERPSERLRGAFLCALIALVLGATPHGVLAKGTAGMKKPIKAEGWRIVSDHRVYFARRLAISGSLGANARMNLPSMSAGDARSFGVMAWQLGR